MMGMRQTSAIEELLQSRKQRRDNPFGGDRARALASALSGMSASAGTYGGKMPQSPGFQEAIKLLGRDEDTTDEQLFENIKVAGLADEAQKNEARRARVLDPLSRGLLESRIKALPIEQVGEIDIRPDMTMGEVEDDPILGQFMKESLPKRPTVTEDIARTKEAERQALRRQPLSDIDKAFLEKKMKEFGIEKQIPSGYTYGEAQDNLFFQQYMDKMKGVQGGLTPWQQIMVTRDERNRIDRINREERKENRAEQKEIKKEVSALSDDIAKSGIPQAWQTMNRINKLLPPEGQDIPGYGQTGALPTFALSKEGKELRNAIQKLLNITLKNRSGAAVTVPEFDRLREEIGLGLLATDDQLRMGLRAALEGLRRETQNILAGFPPEAYQVYVNERGGEDFRSYLGGSGSTSTGSSTPTGGRREWKP